MKKLIKRTIDYAIRRAFEEYRKERVFGGMMVGGSIVASRNVSVSRYYRYPKDIIDEINLSPDVPDEVIYDINTGAYGYSVTDAWMISHGKAQLESIKKYFMFLQLMYESFISIKQKMYKVNPNKKGCKDEGNIHTSPQELLAISSYLYILNSYDVQGDILECGCCFGYSTCCLSLVCDYLDRKLIVADSFEGLPESEDSYYQKGDFAAPFEEVQHNINIFGKISKVEFIKGFYSESLKGFSRPLCAIWIDVDLCSSALDVFENTYSMLSKGGLIFSHEMTAKYFNINNLCEASGDAELPRAFRKFFLERGKPLSGIFLDGSSAVFTVSRIPITPSRIVAAITGINS